MAEILLRADEARSHADRMQTAAGNARDTFSTLRGELSALSDSFRGQAQAAFETRITDWDQGANQVIESLEGLSQWLHQAANQLEDVDAQMGSSLNS